MSEEDKNPNDIIVADADDDGAENTLPRLEPMINSSMHIRVTTQNRNLTKWQRFVRRVKNNLFDWVMTCLLFIMASSLLVTMFLGIRQVIRFSFVRDIINSLEFNGKADLDGDGKILEEEANLYFSNVILSDFNMIYDFKKPKFFKDGERVEPEVVKEDLIKHFTIENIEKTKEIKD